MIQIALLCLPASGASQLLNCIPRIWTLPTAPVRAPACPLPTREWGRFSRTDVSPPKPGQEDFESLSEPSAQAPGRQRAAAGLLHPGQGEREWRRRGRGGSGEAAGRAAESSWLLPPLAWAAL